MALQYGVLVRNAQLDQVEVITGASAYLQLRTGAPPANCAAADSGTLLCEIALPADWMGDAAAGAKALAGSWSGTGVGGGGTVAHFRLKNNAKSVTHAQGTVTATGGGGDLTLDNAVVADGQTITITTFGLTAGNA